MVNSSYPLWQPPLDVIVYQLVIAADALFLVGKIHTLESLGTEAPLLGHKHCNVFFDSWTNRIFRVAQHVHFRFRDIRTRRRFVSADTPLHRLGRLFQ